MTHESTLDETPENAKLLDACVLGNLALANSALAAGASLHCRLGNTAVGNSTHDGMSPLMAAAAFGHLDVLAHLMARLPPGDTKPYRARTRGAPLRALDLACLHDRPACVALLAASTPPLETGTAVIDGHPIVNPGLATSAFGELRYPNGTATLEALLGTAHMDPAQFARFDQVDPLMAAASQSRPDLVAMLLPHFDPKASDAFGHTALMRAADCGSSECLELLLPASDPDHATPQGWTALCFAAESGDPGCLSLLLDLGPPDRHILAALHIACSHGRSEAVKLLAARTDPLAFHSPHPGAPPYTALMCAASEGHVDCCRALIPFGGAGLYPPDLPRSTAANLARSKAGDEHLAEEIEAAALAEALAQTIPGATRSGRPQPL